MPVEVDFLSIHGSGHSTYLTSIAHATSSYNWPWKVIPFCKAGNGDLFCFDFRLADEDPAIVVYDHKISYETSDCFSQIAASFDDLLAKIDV